MNNKKLISQALLEIAMDRAYTEFVEAKLDNELINAAKNIGIVIPSPDFAVIKTVYAEIDKVNRNGVILPRKAVIRGLPTLIGKQVNWEHEGAGRICGYIINAKVEEDKIVIIAVLFKSLFQEEMEVVKEKFDKKELAVSFEIWNVNPDTKESVAKENSKGYKVIDPIIFHGVGLLLAQEPACPNAKVFKLMAKKEEEIKFEKELVYASYSKDKKECKNCTTCTCEKEGEKLEIKEEVKENITETSSDKIEEVKVIEESKKNLCKECGNPLEDCECEEEICAKCKNKKLQAQEEQTTESTENKVEETKVEAEVKPEETTQAKNEEPKEEVKPEETKVEAEVKPEETKVEEVKTEVAQQEVQVVEEKKIVESYNEFHSVIINRGETTERKSFERQISVWNNGEITTNDVEMQVVETFSKLQLEEAVSIARAELQKEIEAKNLEISSLKEEVSKKETEIAKFKVEENKPEQVFVVASKEVDEKYYEEQRKAIDKKAFPKSKK